MRNDVAGVIPYVKYNNSPKSYVLCHINKGCVRGVGRGGKGNGEGAPGEMQWKVARCQGRQAQHSRKRRVAAPSLAGPASTRKGCRASL